jgi:hypothetical protein
MTTHADGFAHISALRSSRHNSRRPKVFGRTSEIPRYRAVISASPMLASTVAAQSSTPKKKNTVPTPRYFIAMSPPPRNELRARPSRATSTARRHARCHRSDCDAGASSADHDTRLRSPTAAGMREVDAEGDCRPGFRCPCRSGSFSGIRLRRIPPCQPFSQFTPALGGSAGVPDSLDTKQVSTSGPTPVSFRFVMSSSLVANALRSPRACPVSHFCFINEVHLSAVLFWAGVEISESSCDCLTCANVAEISVDRTESQSNSPKLTPKTYCVSVRDRVTFVVSPGRLETETPAHPGREPPAREAETGNS